MSSKHRRKRSNSVDFTSFDTVKKKTVKKKVKNDTSLSGKPGWGDWDKEAELIKSIIYPKPTSSRSSPSKTPRDLLDSPKSKGESPRIVLSSQNSSAFSLRTKGNNRKRSSSEKDS